MSSRKQKLTIKSDGCRIADFEPLIRVTDGLTLSQVCAITGLEPSTVQNWVKRGFVARPVEKKYRQRQLARILLISSMRDSMKIENIGELMAMVNGSANDEGDDIIPEERLYDYFCEVIDRAGEHPFETDAESLIASVISDYTGPGEDAKRRLSKALSVMLSAHICAVYKQDAENKLKKMRKEYHHG